MASQVKRADSFWTRLRGLLGRSLAEGEGLFITPCTSVHTFGMSYPIDVVFVDEAGKALTLIHRMKPWRVGPWVKEAAGALELPAGTLEKHGLREGEKVEIPAREKNALSGSRNSRKWLNLLLSALWVFFAASILPHLMSGQANPSAFMLFAVNSFIAILFLTRRDEKRVTDSQADRLITLASIFMSFSLRPAGNASLVSYGVESFLLTVSLVFIFAAYMSLGRSFGLIPADRGLKQRGLYAWVRHPLYGGEMVFCVSFLLANFTVRNLVVTMGVFMSLHLRALAEERLLGFEPAYQTYCGRIRKRYIPFLV